MHLGSTKMIKKIGLATTLLSSLLYADMNEKGFFVGSDVSYLDAQMAYSKKGSVITTANYKSDDSLTSLSLKAGYQYYFTRVYLRVNNSARLKDSEKERFEIKTQVVELNAEYLPLFFKSDDKFFMLKGIVGVGVGINRSSLSSYSVQLDVNTGDAADALLDKDTQNMMEYGGQLGVMGAFDFGLSLELAYRYRSGLMTQFTNEDDSYQATFKLQSSEIYLGANYMF